MNNKSVICHHSGAALNTAQWWPALRVTRAVLCEKRNVTPCSPTPPPPPFPVLNQSFWQGVPTLPYLILTMGVRRRSRPSSRRELWDTTACASSLTPYTCRPPLPHQGTWTAARWSSTSRPRSPCHTRPQPTLWRTAPIR